MRRGASEVRRRQSEHKRKRARETGRERERVGLRPVEGNGVSERWHKKLMSKARERERVSAVSDPTLVGLIDLSVA